MIKLHYTILKRAKIKGSYKLEIGSRGELLDALNTLERKSYLKNLGHSSRNGVWIYKITTNGSKALMKKKHL